MYESTKVHWYLHHYLFETITTSFRLWHYFTECSPTTGYILSAFLGTLRFKCNQPNKLSLSNLKNYSEWIWTYPSPIHLVVCTLYILKSKFTGSDHRLNLKHSYANFRFVGIFGLGTIYHMMSLLTEFSRIFTQSGHTVVS